MSHPRIDTWRGINLTAALAKRRWLLVTHDERRAVLLDLWARHLPNDGIELPGQHGEGSLRECLGIVADSHLLWLLHSPNYALEVAE
jgi:hypothetical protein